MICYGIKDGKLCSKS